MGCKHGVSPFTTPPGRPLNGGSPDKSQRGNRKTERPDQTRRRTGGISGSNQPARPHRAVGAKDMFDREGRTPSWGGRIQREAPSERSAAVIERLEAAGSHQIAALLTLGAAYEAKVLVRLAPSTSQGSWEDIGGDIRPGATLVSYRMAASKCRWNKGWESWITELEYVRLCRAASDRRYALSVTDETSWEQR